MLRTRNYKNYFIEVISDEVTEACYNKKQAIDMVENLQTTIEELTSFIEGCKD